MDDKLTPAVKRKLNITWSDPDTDARVTEVIEDAKAAIVHKVGLPQDFDFQKAGEERSLLLAFCLYAWNHAENEFDANYFTTIQQLRRKWEVSDVQADAL